jgi:hypothetical protein
MDINEAKRKSIRLAERCREEAPLAVGREINIRFDKNTRFVGKIARCEYHGASLHGRSIVGTFAVWIEGNNQKFIVSSLPRS